MHELPDIGKYFPTAQWKQAVPLRLDHRPLGQVVHEPVLYPEEYLPAGQAVQTPPAPALSGARISTFRLQYRVL
jgi:hypothetical protein